MNNGIRYNLTERAFPYYFEGNDFGDNPDHLSYLCYSRLVPDRVVSSQAVHQFDEPGRNARMEFALLLAGTRAKTPPGQTTP